MVIIGAGVAGLAAARRLRLEHGVERVVVLEARSGIDRSNLKSAEARPIDNEPGPLRPNPFNYTHQNIIHT